MEVTVIFGALPMVFSALRAKTLDVLTLANDKVVAYVPASLTDRICDLAIDRVTNSLFAAVKIESHYQLLRIGKDGSASKAYDFGKGNILVTGVFRYAGKDLVVLQTDSRKQLLVEIVGGRSELIGTFERRSGIDDLIGHARREAALDICEDLFWLPWIPTGLDIADPKTTLELASVNLPNLEINRAFWSDDLGIGLLDKEFLSGAVVAHKEGKRYRRHDLSDLFPIVRDVKSIEACAGLAVDRDRAAFTFRNPAGMLTTYILSFRSGRPATEQKANTIVARILH